MLFSDVYALHKSLRTTTVTNTDGNRYNDQVDMDIERMYAGSPQVSEWPVAYNFDNLYRVEAEEVTSSDGCPPSAVWSSSVEYALPVFSSVPVKAASTQMSALTRTLEDASMNQRSQGKPQANGIPLTIYLPDCSSMNVFVREQCTFRELIEQVLKEHSSSCLDPPLEYDHPSFYEVRIHEGDGEADHDFAAFEASKPLKQYDLDEYCLCEVDGHVTTVRDESSFAINVFQSMDMLPGQGAGTDPLGLLKNRSSMAIPPALLDDNSYDQYAPETFTDTRPFPGDAMDAMETATIRFPNGATVDVPFEADTTLSALLPLIAKLFPLTKLRLYTDEYVFSLSQPDFKRLQYVSPKIDSKTKVASVGTTYFELTKKTYADSMKVVKKALPDGQTAPAVRPTEVEFHFSEATANAYQEWNTVKKNRFGRRQERIFGVDGKRVYNGKRGQLKGGANQKNVQRAERDISSIVSIDILPTDNKTFRITWRDDKDLYDIEYTFETSRECAEVVAKIKFIRNRDIANARNPSFAVRT